MRDRVVDVFYPVGHRQVARWAKLTGYLSTAIDRDQFRVL